MEKFLKRIVAEKNTFKVDGTFESMYAAQRWIHEKGYDDGSTCATMPTAIMKGKYEDYGLPQKWKNMTSKERNSVHGAMTGDMRDGPVFVRIFKTI